MRNIQYTIRNIPEPVNQALRKRAQQNGKSFNQTVVEALTVNTLGTKTPEVDHNFDWMFNKNTLDACFDDAVEELSQVDESLWQ